MSFDKGAFNSVYDDLISNGNGQFGGAQSEDDLLRLSWILAQSSLAL